MNDELYSRYTEAKNKLKACVLEATDIDATYSEDFPFNKCCNEIEEYNRIYEQKQKVLYEKYKTINQELDGIELEIHEINPSFITIRLRTLLKL